MMIMKWFKKKKYPSNQKFELLIIDDNSDELSVSLGISPERKDEMFDIVFAAYKESKCLSSAAQTILRHMNHINEVTYSIMMLNKIHHHKPESSLFDVLRKMTGE
jgi:hypothetical protein